MAQLIRHSLNLNFLRNTLIRRSLNEIEDAVRGSSIGGYGQPQMVPLPDDIEPEMPRVIFTSQAGHTQLLLSQLALTLSVSYSEDWAGDFEKCKHHLLSKVSFLFAIGNIGWKDQAPLFCGVNTACRIAAESSGHAVQMVAPSFTRSAELLSSANELSYRWSLDVDERFYNNTSVECVTQLKDGGQLASDAIPRFNRDTIQAYSVDVSVDYNDRLAFNSLQDYRSNADTVREMIEAGLIEARKAVSSIEQGC
ncbi:hypothetical protein [Xanthomonas axonopodis]|uniref:hypothetical protein n=1 Tax=Xanthomonas axonopodis TaxID=53413 RepID=UPI0035585D0B